MFARKLSMYLKNDGALAFKQKMDAEIIPLLRQQQGFLHEIIFLNPNGREVEAFSLWDTAEHAEAYNWFGYPEVACLLASVIDGAPLIETFEVLNSTIQKASNAAFRLGV